MIIKSNLATQPTRNYTLYFLGCLVLTIIAIGFSIYNLRGLLITFSANSSLRAKIEQQQKVRADYQREAQALRTRITAIKTPEFVSETEFLNNAIKRRVFSWTTLFDDLEAVFPSNVRMLSVSPAIVEDTISISMEVTGKSLEDIVELIRKLQDAPAFDEVVFKSERKNDKDGSMEASITLRYLQDHAASEKAAGKEEKKPTQSGEKTL